jgi:hypothetical protein
MFDNVDFNLNIRQNVEARHLGDALRVGNDPDVRAQLSQVLFDPAAREIIRHADYIATRHAPWDVHGPYGMGVETLQINPDNSVDLINKDTNTSTKIAVLGDWRTPGRML